MTIPHIRPFRAADRARFCERCPQFAGLLNEPLGLRAWNLVNSDGGLRQMAFFTVRGEPAVAGITVELDPLLAQLDAEAENSADAAARADRLRRAIGSMVREVLEVNGFRRTGRRRAVPPVPRRLFQSAEVFEQVPLPAPDDGFDWDGFVGAATFREVSSLSPELSGRRLPSMFSPDRRWFYVSSEDLDVEVGSENMLRQLLNAVGKSYGRELAARHVDHLRRHQRRHDFCQLCYLLAEVVNVPEEFADPDALLERFARMQDDPPATGPASH